eukprot:scaffold147861_cov21-Tisochrysis_lutea.AAC.1
MALIKQANLTSLCHKHAQVQPLLSPHLPGGTASAPTKVHSGQASAAGTWTVMPRGRTHTQGDGGTLQARTGHAQGD